MHVKLYLVGLLVLHSLSVLPQAIAEDAELSGVTLNQTGKAVNVTLQVDKASGAKVEKQANGSVIIKVPKTKLPKAYQEFGMPEINGDNGLKATVQSRGNEVYITVPATNGKPVQVKLQGAHGASTLVQQQSAPKIVKPKPVTTTAAKPTTAKSTSVKTVAAKPVAKKVVATKPVVKAAPPKKTTVVAVKPQPAKPVVAKPVAKKVVATAPVVKPQPAKPVATVKTTAPVSTPVAAPVKTAAATTAAASTVADDLDLATRPTTPALSPNGGTTTPSSTLAVQPTEKDGLMFAGDSSSAETVLPQPESSTDRSAFVTDQPLVTEPVSEGLIPNAIQEPIMGFLATVLEPIGGLSVLKDWGFIAAIVLGLALVGIVMLGALIRAMSGSRKIPAGAYDTNADLLGPQGQYSEADFNALQGLPPQSNMDYVPQTLSQFEMMGEDENVSMPSQDQFTRSTPVQQQAEDIVLGGAMQPQPAAGSAFEQMIQPSPAPSIGPQSARSVLPSQAQSEQADLDNEFMDLVRRRLNG